MLWMVRGLWIIILWPKIASSGRSQVVGLYDSFPIAVHPIFSLIYSNPKMIEHENIQHYNRQ